MNIHPMQTHYGKVNFGSQIRVDMDAYNTKGWNLEYCRKVAINNPGEDGKVGVILGSLDDSDDKNILYTIVTNDPDHELIFQDDPRGVQDDPEPGKLKSINDYDKAKAAKKCFLFDIEG